MTVVAVLVEDALDSEATDEEGPCTWEGSSAAVVMHASVPFWGRALSDDVSDGDEEDGGDGKREVPRPSVVAAFRTPSPPTRALPPASQQSSCGPLCRALEAAAVPCRLGLWDGWACRGRRVVLPGSTGGTLRRISAS